MSDDSRGPVLPFPLNPPALPPLPRRSGTPTEGSPTRASATVYSLYRVRMIIKVQGEDRPRSFRTEERAGSFTEAWASADRSLAKLAHDEGWTGMYEVLLQGSCYRVPGTDLPAPGEASRA